MSILNSILKGAKKAYKSGDNIVEEADNIKHFDSQSDDALNLQPNVEGAIQKSTDEFNELKSTEVNKSVDEINDLINEGNTGKGGVYELYNETHKMLDKKDSTFFDGWSKLQKEQAQLDLDSAFRSGIDANIIEDIVDNGAKKSFDKIKYREEFVRKLKSIEPNLGDDIEKAFELLELQPIDHKFINKTGNREKYIKSVEDIKTRVDSELSTMFDDVDITLQQRIREVADSLYDDAFDNTIRDSIRFGSFNRLDGIYGGNTAKRIRELANKDYDFIHGVFKTRNRMDEFTQRLVDDPTEALVKRDVLPAYSPNRYKIDGKVEILPVSQVDDIMRTIGGQAKVKPFGKPFTVLDEFGVEQRLQKVMIKSFENEQIQGAVQFTSKLERGSLTDIEHLDFKVNPSNNKQYLELDGDSYRIDELAIRTPENNLVATIKNDGSDYSSYMLNKSKQDGNEVRIKTIHRYVTKEEERLLGRDDNYINNLSRYLSKERAHLAETTITNKINKEFTTDINISNIAEFATELMDETVSHKNLFVSMDNDAFLKLKEAGLVSAFSKQYVKVPFNSNLNARYIQRKYAQEMYGFNKWFITNGKDFTKRMVEEFYDIGIGFARESVALKNPITLMSNFVSNSFFMVMSGLNPSAVMKHYPVSLDSIKLLHQQKSQLIRMELEHGMGIAKEMTEYKAIQEIMKDNIAFQAQQAGVLKSLLDDGLWDRLIRENPDMDFGEKVIKNILMTKDSKAGIKVRELTDTVDILGRVTSFKLHRDRFAKEMYGVEFEQLIDPEQIMNVTKKSAKLTDDLMINYNRLLNPGSMFLRDKGIAPFINWYQRSLPVMYKVAKQNPKRLMIFLAMYETIQETLGDENQYGDEFILGVRTESFNHYNTVLDINNWGDMFSPLMLDPVNTMIPQIYKHLQEGQYDKAFLGINYNNSRNPLLNTETNNATTNENKEI